MKKSLFVLCFWMIFGLANAQLAWLIPENPSVNDTVTLYFNAAEGNKTLKGYTGDIYLHAGVITNKSLDGHDWKFVVGNWGTADPRVLMKREKPDLYSFRFIPRQFYNLQKEDIARQLSFVFRNTDGTIVGKTTENEDILVAVEGYKPPLKQKNNNTDRIQKFKNLQTNTTGWIIFTDLGNIHLTPYTNSICEAQFFPTGRTKRDSSDAVILKPQLVAHKTEKTRSGYRLTAGDLIILVNKSPVKLMWIYKKDTLLTEESSLFARSGNTSVKFRIAKDERIYGTGERSVPMNRIGNSYPLYNRPFYGYETNALMLNYSVPVTLSSKIFAVLWDNPQKGYVDIGKTEKNIIEWSAIGGPARYLLIAGDSYPNLMENYTLLTGRQSLPPRWALGNLQSRMAYRNQKETDSIVTLMKKKGFPLDAIILDFYWFGDSILGHLGTLDWYKKAWPEPEAMINKFSSLGINTILITEPYIIDSMANFKGAAKLGIFATDSTGKPYVNKQFYFGPGGLIDIFKPAARDWFWSKYKAQIDKGIAAWWGDLGEPESHPSDIYHVNGKADEVHNIYGHYWDKMLFEKYQEFYPHTRLFHLQRSGYAGTQRYSAFPWTGDVSRSWGGLQAQLPMLLTMGLNGLGYIHSDAGGFAQGVKDEELYIRWLQFASFTPILRPHGSGIPSEPVFFSENTQEIVKKYIKLRYTLLPYNYTLAYQNAIHGEPLMRPLFYYYPNDKDALDAGKEYFWGENMLISPVIEKGITIQKVYLPEGSWMDFHTSKEYQGKQWIDFPVSIADMPIFVRKGSFIPMTSLVYTIRDYNPNYIKLMVYPDNKPCSYVQFEDNGIDAQSLLNQNFETLEYSCKPVNKGYFLKMERKGDWKEAPKQRKMEVQIRYRGKTPTVKVNGIEYSVQNPDKDNKSTYTFQYNEPWINVDFIWIGKIAVIEVSE